VIAELLDTALSLAGRGWRVIPLRPGDKRPAIRDWEARATTDPARIHRAWAAAEFNIGIACGPSGLVVIDLDLPKHGDPPPPRWAQPGIRDGLDVLAALADSHRAPVPVETYTVRTASGGEHLYFGAPDRPVLRNTTARLGWLVDTRAAGGYVVAAGSRIQDRRYGEILDLPPARLPAWISRLLQHPDPPPARYGELVATVARRSRYAATALRGELDRVLAARPGTRNHTLNAAAYALGQLTGAGLLPTDLANDALSQAAAAVGLPPGEAAATNRSGLTAGSRHPRRPPRSSA
jgi:hypothetical protein